jgi:hypothetical protein
MIVPSGLKEDFLRFFSHHRRPTHISQAQRAEMRNNRALVCSVLVLKLDFEDAKNTCERRKIKTTSSQQLFSCALSHGRRHVALCGGWRSFSSARAITLNNGLRDRLENCLESDNPDRRRRFPLSPTDENEGKNIV